MSPTYCVARDMALRAFSVPTNKTDHLMVRRNTQKRCACAHALKCSLLWRREVVVCPWPWDAGEEILPRNRREEKNSEIG